MEATQVILVFLAALATALATGLGVLPLAVHSAPSQSTVGLGFATAAGLMTAASIALVQEGAVRGEWSMVVGMGVGVVAVAASAALLNRSPTDVHNQFHVTGVGGGALLIGVMTAHSFAEGVGVGVSFGSGAELGAFVTIAIAVHNIPEGLAVALTLLPRGTSTVRAAGWAIFTSLPQPIVAVPAFVFVEFAERLLPAGLGFAAGAMLWMVAASLLPSSMERAGPRPVGLAFGLSTVAMLALQAVLR